MTEPRASWLQSLQAFLHPRVITMLFYGFSAGIPLLLIFSSLSLWLIEAGIERASVTYFSWAALAYSFKFVWAPLVDRLPLPLLTRLLGRRRAWLLASQIAIAFSILLIASIDPSQAGLLNAMAVAVVCLGFSAATQDIVIDAYRIESAGEELQALMSSTYIAGYRVGMLVSGAGSLILAEHLGSSRDAYLYSAWQVTYGLMALTMLVGIITTLIIREPANTPVLRGQFSSSQYARFLVVFLMAVMGFVLSYAFSSDVTTSLKAGLADITSNQTLANFVIELLRMAAAVAAGALVIVLLSYTPLYERDLVQQSYVDPIRDFFTRYGVKLALLVLLFIGFYRVSDIVLGVIANIFFEEIGFSKNEIAAVAKTFGLVMTIFGGFLGGILAYRYGAIRVLYLGAALTVATNLLFMWLAGTGPKIEVLYVVISADNLSAGVASAAFVAFLSRLTNISFTAMQYAIFSSLMTLFPKIIGGYSGGMVENLGYANFFLVASLMGVPVLLLIWLLQRHPQFRQ